MISKKVFSLLFLSVFSISINGMSPKEKNNESKKVEDLKRPLTIEEEQKIKMQSLIKGLGIPSCEPVNGMWLQQLKAYYSNKNRVPANPLSTMQRPQSVNTARDLVGPDVERFFFSADEKKEEKNK